MKAALDTNIITIIPSRQLIKYIRGIEDADQIPESISNIRLGEPNLIHKGTIHRNFVSFKDRHFIQSLKLEPMSLKNYEVEEEYQKSVELDLNDLIWLRQHIQKTNSKVYLHELLMGSKIILPKNMIIPRSKQLDERCRLLKIQEENCTYRSITKNIDNVRKSLPEDTISYQIKQLNKQLIAVAQFVISVLAGFLFGFHGIELMVGSLDFGFRLLLGIICSLIIALAELYFLAKKLNEEYDVTEDDKNGHFKLN